MSVEDAASLAGVSTATIRNWLKTGYLQYAGRGMITRASFERFQKEVSGKEKLKQRGNKSRKDDHDHSGVTSSYLCRIASGTHASEALGAEYERNLSDSYRNREGVYYTPPKIVENLFNIDVAARPAATFCDPCCGSGNFVERALSLGFKPENIYAFDTDPVAVELTKRRIYEKTGFRSASVKQADFLEIHSRDCPEKFDVIFTNPPWGKKLRRKYREQIGNAVRAGASIDTCSLFFFACLSALSKGGTLGLLLPEAFFNIAAFEDARKRALGYTIGRLVDYGKPFCGLLTKAQGLVLAKSPDKSNGRILCESNGEESERTAASFANNPKSILNMRCSRRDADAISHIYSLPHVTLKNNAAWGLGIVTGNNGKFIENKPGEGLIPVFKGADVTRSGLREPSCYIPADLSLYQQVAPVEFYEAKEKIIYRFISSRLCFVYDTEQRFVLNSANVLIPDSGFPVRMSVLCDLLNSDFMNWVFSRIFNTYKILRADLEALPIYPQFLGKKTFVEEEYIARLGIKKDRGGAFKIKGG